MKWLRSVSDRGCETWCMEQSFKLEVTSTYSHSIFWESKDHSLPQDPKQSKPMARVPIIDPKPKKTPTSDHRGCAGQAFPRSLHIIGIQQSVALLSSRRVESFHGALKGCPWMSMTKRKRCAFVQKIVLPNIGRFDGEPEYPEWTSWCSLDKAMGSLVWSDHLSSETFAAQRHTPIAKARAASAQRQ